MHLLTCCDSINLWDVRELAVTRTAIKPLHTQSDVAVEFNVACNRLERF